MWDSDKRMPYVRAVETCAWPGPPGGQHTRGRGYEQVLDPASLSDLQHRDVEVYALCSKRKWASEAVGVHLVSAYSLAVFPVESTVCCKHLQQLKTVWSE